MLTKFKFRLAEEKDMKFLFELRNDPIVIKNSLISNKVEWNEHKKWFTDALKNHKRRIFIVIFKEKDIGQIRFDENKDSAEISVSLVAEYRGKGCGSTILKQACEFGFSNFNYNKIIAKIKEDNIASIKSFTRIGFLEKVKENSIVIMELSKIKIGLKLWSTNKDLFDEANLLYEKSVIDYVELYIVPGSYNDFDFNKLKMPIIIHAPHYGHGFNIADKKNRDSNLIKLKETIKFADKLKSKHIIIHAGFNGNISVAKEFLDLAKDNRILIENMPMIALDGSECIGYELEGIKHLIEKKFGFCLDFAHAIKSSISLNKNYKEFINRFLKLNPKMFHVCGVGSLKDKKDKHLNLWKDKTDLIFIKKCIMWGKNKMVTFEVPKEGSSLENDIKNIKYFNSLEI
jgi:deoxyribonuclease-4